METTPLHRIPVKGGVLSPGEMLRAIALARDLGLSGLHFGSRQDILLPVETPAPEVLERHLQIELQSLANDVSSNIVSSYVSTDIFPKTAWLTSSAHLYILEQFQFTPRLEINITDPKQRLVPLFSGHLNFIASPEEDYWYLYVRMPHWPELEPFPALIHTWDIARVAMAVDPFAEKLEDMASCVQRVNDKQQLQLKSITEDLNIPFRPFPFYEGMNRLDSRQYWLGLYWRNNWYDLDFLEATCELCMAHRIGKICITPWKSFIISGIPDQRRIEWEKLLGRFGINARHSSLELNWHLPIADGEALALKRYLVREFDQRDISTYGLTFGVEAAYTWPFTSIIIQRENGQEFIDGFAVRPTYNLRYARNFDPNIRHYVEYARRVDRTELTELILELTKIYFEQLNEEQDAVISTGNREEVPEVEITVSQCSRCQSVYDPELGDPDRGVAAGTSFEALPADYTCWTCSAGKAKFREVVLTVVEA